MQEWDDDTKVSAHLGVAGENPADDRNRAYLIVLAGSNVGEMFKIGKAEIVIGRGQGVDVQILDEGISRRHATIRVDGNDIIVQDLGSRNGTFANGLKIDRHVLSDGDKIQVGSTTILKFTYHDKLDESFQKQMYESALRDALTKAFNRKYFLDRLDSEFRFAKRHRVPLSLVMFDIDHFKNINDSHGHVAGDYVLATLARRVHDIIRTEDVFARYGGEEFAVICRAIDLPKANLFAERLRSNIQATEFRFEQALIPVTVSLGVAGLPQVDVEDPLALVSAADQALYDAKRGGRNRVELAIGPASAASR